LFTGETTKSVPFVLRSPGTQTLSASSGQMTGTSRNLLVVPNAFNVAVTPGASSTTLKAGAPATIVVAPIDYNGVALCNFSGNLAFTSSDHLFVGPISPAFASPSRCGPTNASQSFQATFYQAPANDLRVAFAPSCPVYTCWQPSGSVAFSVCR